MNKLYILETIAKNEKQIKRFEYRNDECREYFTLQNERLKKYL